MCDTEVLILAVEKYPCLWNITHEDYHDRDLKDLAWEQVCAEIYTDWGTTVEKEKQDLCTQAKKKWNNTRDSFRRDINKIKNTPTGSSAKKAKKYVYSDLLSFLKPLFQHRSHEGNYGDQDNSSDGIDKETPNQRDDDEEYVTTKVQNETRRKNKPSSKTDVPNEILNLMKKRTQNGIVEDDDTKFLLSFRRDMQEMNKGQKLNFRIGMLQLLKNITEPNKPRNSSSASSNSYSQYFSVMHIPSQEVAYVPSPSPSSQVKYVPSPSASSQARYVPSPSPTYTNHSSHSPYPTTSTLFPHNSQPTPSNGNNLGEFLTFSNNTGTNAFFR